MSYVAGTRVTFSATFKDETTGELADPTAVSFLYRVGTAERVRLDYGTSAIVHDGTGEYHVDIDTTGLDGAWVYEWACSGTLQAISEPVEIDVVRPAIPVS
jgi:hypothetical protein